MSTELPSVVHTYDHYLIDSTRWDAFTPRDDDIVISTSIKSGTTWMQAILWHLLLPPQERTNLYAASPWLETTFVRVNAMLEHLERQRHRRFIKTHLPLDGLPFHAQVRYIVLGRDARDVFLSLWNHHSSFTNGAWKWLVLNAKCFGRRLERPDNIRVFWREWITTGWFEWESEGYPYWGNLHHTSTWWRFRHLGNILFIHYADLLADLRGEIRRVVDFLDIECSPQKLEEVAASVTFRNMRERAGQWLPGVDWVFRGGGKTFVFRGENGRWRGVFSDEELNLYEAAKAKTLERECEAWLEGGRSALTAR